MKNQYDAAANDSDINIPASGQNDPKSSTEIPDFFPLITPRVIKKSASAPGKPPLSAHQQVAGSDLSTRARQLCVHAANHQTCPVGLLDFALGKIYDAIYLIDANACFVEVNEQACRALGYTREELLGMSIQDIDPDFKPEHWLVKLKAIDEQASYILETCHKTKDGRIFPVEVSCSHFCRDNQQFIFALVRDISARRQEEAIKLRHQQDFRALVENSPDPIVRFAPDCTRIYANPAYIAKIGKPQSELLGTRPSEDGDLPAMLVYEERLREVINTGIGCEMELECTKGPGGGATHLARLTPETGPLGEVSAVLCVSRDITSIKESRRRLERAEALAHIGHWEWDDAREASLVSDEACRIYGQPCGWRPRLNDAVAQILEGDRERIIQTFKDAYRRRSPDISCNYRIKREGDGGIRYLQNSVHIEYDGQSESPRYFIGTVQDVTELKTYEHYLNELATNDTLTGLPNRSQFHAQANKAIAEASRNQRNLGILVMDLDRFKGINESFGHDIGDRVLCELAERLKLTLRTYDTIARLSGDQFAIITPGISDAANLERIADKIFRCFSNAFLHHDKEIYITPSIGIAMYPSDALEASALVQCADTALGHAKERGRACYQFYNSELTARSRDRLRLETALRHAIARQELELYYQPKIDLGTGRLVGAEALLRWHHPEIGMVPPDKFIRIAEDSGQISGIGSWVVNTACATAQRWNQNGHPLKIAVNLSSRQFRDDDLFTTVCNALALTGCEPQWLELEITESLLLGGDDKVRKTLQSFRNMGISIAIDDFGTGYSALGYLKRFPISVLKIDRSFTTDVTIEHDSTELVKAIISMARSIGLELVAEGIETKTQEQFLQAHGCHLGQGYLYSKPVPLDIFEVSLTPGGNGSLHWTA